LRCGKLSWFCHIEASALQFLGHALIVSGNNGLNDCGKIREADVLSLQGSYQRLIQVGTFERMTADRKTRALAAAALLLSALGLGGCSSIADLPLVGTPADAPARPREAGGYLPVHDLPPDRDEAAMPPAEQAKIQSELAAARDRQAAAAAGNAAAKR
jgi:hypothetical protein